MTNFDSNGRARDSEGYLVSLCQNCMQIHSTATLCRVRLPESTSGYHSDRGVGTRLQKQFFDPTQPLLDRFFANDKPSLKIEQPIEGCMCLGYGLLSKEWLYKRPSKCDCHIQSDDYDNFLHALDCDSVPCPFCRTESAREN